MQKRFARTSRVPGVVFLIAAAGCAKTTVKSQKEVFATGLPTPSVVLVYRFAVDTRDVTENQGFFQQAINSAGSTTEDQRTLEIARQVRQRLAEDFVAQINALGLPAQLATRDTYVPANALVIIGNFVDIDEGNRLRRLVIGFGAGGAQVDTQVRVLSPSASGYRSLLEFTTHADSGHIPGPAATMGAGAAAQGAVTGGMVAANAAVTGVKAYRSEVERMAGRKC
jgi:uncharacterized protein DUF4410